MLEFAGHAIGFAVSCIAHDGEFPFSILFIKDGTRKLVHVDVDTIERALDFWNDWCEENPHAVELSAFTVDGISETSTAERGIIIAHLVNHANGEQCQVFMRYRPKKLLRPIAVTPPRLRTLDSAPRPLSTDERTIFIRGVQSVKRAAAFWSKRLDSI